MSCHETKEHNEVGDYQSEKYEEDNEVSEHVV